jgi:uncharacterized protein (TIGR02246 family)
MRKLSSLIRIPFLLLTAVAVVAASWAIAQSGGATKPAEAGKDASPVLATVQAALNAYAKAINDQNHDGIAAAWAENAEHISDDGVRTEGRTAIAAMFKKTLTDNPKLTVTLAANTVKSVSADVLLVEGRAEVVTGDARDTSLFESVWVKAGDRWQISRVRELAPVAAASDGNYDHLKELEWLVGNWSATSDAYAVTLTAKWGRNRNFLLLEKTVKSGADEVITVTRVVGWDPVYGCLRVWNFDSDGGFGGSLVTRVGNSWNEDVESLTRNGGEATSKQTTRFINAESFEWTATDRTLDDAPLPDLKLQFTRMK